MAQQTEIIGRTTSSLAEVVERILDKGIVIDAWVNVSVVGIELVSIEARVIVASLETYSRYARLLGEIGPIARGIGEQNRPKSLKENVGEIGQGLHEALPLSKAMPLDFGKSETKSKSAKRPMARAGNKRKSNKRR